VGQLKEASRSGTEEPAFEDLNTGSVILRKEVDVHIISISYC